MASFTLITFTKLDNQPIIIAFIPKPSLARLKPKKLEQFNHSLMIA
jgi:hypothetical protein